MLTTKISFLRSGVNIGIEGTFQIGLFAEDKIKEFVVELVINVGEDYNNQQLICLFKSEYKKFTASLDLVTFIKTIIHIISRVRD